MSSNEIQACAFCMAEAPIEATMCQGCGANKDAAKTNLKVWLFRAFFIAPSLLLAVLFVVSLFGLADGNYFAALITGFLGFLFFCIGWSGECCRRK